MKETEVQLGRNDTNPLTRYQMEKLKLAAMGLSNKEIAKRVSITAHSVKDAFNNIYDKLGVNSKHQALVLAIHSGWLDPEQCVGESDLSLFEALTPRQLKVVKLIAVGKTIAEIAEDIVITRGVVENYLNTLYSHLGIENGDNVNKRGRAAVLYHAYSRRNNV